MDHLGVSKKQTQKQHTDINNNHSMIGILPSRWHRYGVLMRLDRPIGTWLLYIPCVWGIIWGATHMPTHPNFGNIIYLVIASGLGALCMRSAGCIWNDISDRKLDKLVARTSNRPIANGTISVMHAIILMLALLLCALVIVTTMGFYATILAACSLGLIGIYPFCKRITWWPQLWLGMTFNWGILIGYSAITNDWPAAHIWLLWLGAISWTIAYDTIYAHQDSCDDMLVGIKSTALLFGKFSRGFIAVFFITALAIWLLTGYYQELSILFYLFFIPALAHVFWQCKSFKHNKPAICLKIFKSNRNFGFLIGLSFVLGLYTSFDV